MAGFDQLVRTLVGVANNLTASLQANVTLYSYANATVDDSGHITDWGAGALLSALVENVNTLTRNQQGELVLATTKITFLQPVLIDVRDRIVLPDGKSAPIARISGLIDPGSTGPQHYLTDVYLASSGGSGW